MEERNTTSDFILLELFNYTQLHRSLFAMVLTIATASLFGNVSMLLLILQDPQLHTPMYFLLSQLSLMDLMLVSTIVPKMAAGYLTGKRTISPGGCGLQIFTSLSLGGGECFLLAAMSYDRYVAVCHPLRYPVLMSWSLCLQMTMGSWMLGAADGLIQAAVTLSFPFCNAHTLNHFFCETPVLVRLACADTSSFEYVMYICCVLMLLLPFSLILTSYALILATVLRMPSTDARKKAFATCSSHLAVVGLFYGAAIFMYMRPTSYRSANYDKVVSACYTIITPILNPLIYSLRNNEVKSAVKRWRIMKLNFVFNIKRMTSSKNSSIVLSANNSLITKLMLEKYKLENFSPGIYRHIFMEKWNQTSSDFILLGLLPPNQTGLLLLLLIVVLFFLALLGNSAMIYLIAVDSRLHTPMYFLLSQLSLSDLMYISTTVPKMVFNYISGRKSISFLNCGIQSFFFLTMAGSEGLLLASMAYDRFVAICQPLHYPIRMSKRICVKMITGSWILGSINSLAHTVYALHIPYCRSRAIKHFFCDVPAMLPLACVDTWVYEYMVFVSTSLFLLFPFLGITASYGRVLFAVYHMRSKEGRKKAYTTCSTHLIVVTFYYTPFVFTYLRPKTLRSPSGDKILAVFYTILTPMLNPIIYSLRNKEVLGAMARVLGMISTKNH
ncbi:uncharacterized protein RHO17_014286 [Thomomys bottae]